MSSTPHSFSVRIYWEDTDAGGVVYYANYLKFAERARTEALRAAGFDQTALLRDHNAGFVVRHCEVDFLKPARLDDCLTIESRLHDISRVSFCVEQTLKRGEEVLVKLAVKLAVIDREMKLTKLPESVKDSMQNVLT